MIAPEGKIILIPLILLVLSGTGIYANYPIEGLKWINMVLAILILFSLYFFRNPQRIPPENEGFLSPADGKVVQIIDVDDSEIGKGKKISIFLSIFDVHSQRVPLSSKVLSKQYNSGNFLAAFNHQASLNNEQTVVVFKTEDGKKFKIKQIAGFIARRILNYMEPGNMVQRGQRLGFIRFGSRVDIIIPRDFQIDVSLGDMVQGNQTIIGRFH